MKTSALFGILLLLLSGCQNANHDEPAPSVNTPVPGKQPATAPREFKLEGDVVSIDKEKKAAVIKHGPIEGYMGAMTMSYPVPDAKDLDMIKPGDHITATVYDSEADSRYWVGKIQVGAAKGK